MPTKVAYYPLGGGLDVVTPAISVKPGRALTMRNFEPWYNGGYRRIPGFERWDGRPRPSDASFDGFNLVSVSGLSVGDTITGDISGTTGVVVGIDGVTIGVTKVVGSGFQNGEGLDTATYTVASAPVTFGAPTISLTEDWLLVAENEYRDDILVIPGSGDPGGAWRRRATSYAVRDNVGATAGILHKNSAAGWTTTGITMADYIFFDAGTANGPFAEGDTVTGTISGATATVHRVILQAGAWAGDAEGYIVLTGVAGGPFVNNDLLQVAATTYATATGANATFAFSPGGRYEFINHNFFGGVGTYRTYGCNGLDPAFEIDENHVVSPILFPETELEDQPSSNTPFLIEEHRSYLFIAIPGGRFQHSVIGQPLQFNGFLGAADFGIGDEVTGMNSVVGGVLAVHSEHEVRGLFGKNISDWEMKLLAEKTGGRLFTCQKVDTVYALDDLGITSLARSDTFGDFVGATVSQLIQPLVTNLRDNITASTITRESNQYRLYFDDPVNSALVMYIPAAGALNRSLGLQTRVGVEFGYLSYPFPVEKIYNTEDETGKERIYFTSSDGYVYEDQIGRNFDGDVITSYVRLVFNHVGSPSYRKRFRRVELGANTQNVIDVKFISSLTYDSVDTENGITDAEVQGLGGYWDIDSWDGFVWDGQAVSTGKAGLTGTGENISFLIYNETAKAEAWVMHGITLHYDMRRLQR